MSRLNGGAMRTAGPRHAGFTSPNNNNYYAPISLEHFHEFLLQMMNSKTAEDRLRYAKQFSDMLQSRNASSLLQLTADKRIHVMKALSNLAKFTRQYDGFLELRQRYNLKWSTGNEKLDAFTRLFDDTKTG